MRFPGVREPLTFPRFRLTHRSLWSTNSRLSGLDQWLGGPGLCSLFSNFRFGMRETGSICDGDRFVEPNIACQADVGGKAGGGAEFKIDLLRYYQRLSPIVEDTHVWRQATPSRPQWRQRFNSRFDRKTAPRAGPVQLHRRRGTGGQRPWFGSASVFAMSTRKNAPDSTRHNSGAMGPSAVSAQWESPAGLDS